jgi:hypothetical protein
MSTAQDLLNNVLRGLRRDVLTSASTTNSYHLLLLQYLNVAKSQIEQLHPWMANRQTVTVTLPASTQTVTLSAAGAADVDVIEGSRLLYVKNSSYGDGEIILAEKEAGAQPQVFDTTSSSEYALSEMSWEKFERLRLTDDGETDTYPQYFALRYTGGYYEMGVWPMATGQRTLSMRFAIPQADIPNTAMTAYTLQIPSQPVWLRALLMAAQERGEDVGRPVPDLNDDAKDALYFAINRERSDEDNTVIPV